MKAIQIACMALVGGLVLASIGGCVSKEQYDKCVRRNEIQQQRIAELEATQENRLIGNEQFEQRYNSLNRQLLGCNDKVSALQAALDQKNAMIAELAEKMGQIALPPELSNALADWAAQTGSDMVSYDPQSGIVRFKSDLLFDLGSDDVSPGAISGLQKLATILNSSMAQGFDVLVVGHTDDMRISRPDTKAKHPTNWHLSAHRAISVQQVLVENNMDPNRIAVIGLGEYRPIEPNQPNKKGNPKNRRVEIYIVPAGQLQIAK